MLTKRQIATAYVQSLRLVAEHIEDNPEVYFGAEDAVTHYEGFSLKVNLHHEEMGITPSVQVRRESYLPGEDGIPIRTVRW